MTPSEREALEARLTERSAAGAHGEAAEAIVRGFGPEILGFLVGTLRDQVAAEDVFSTFCEQLLKALPGFEGKCSYRTFSYALARNAAYQYRVAQRRRGKREVSPDSRFSLAVAEVRSQTAQHLRTEVKSRFAALRDELPEEDRTILVLRVDKQLGFEDIARVLLATEGLATEPDAAALKKEAARLRKRFQLVKERLVQLGRAQGLIGDD